MQQTHLKVNQVICGTPIELKEDYSLVSLKTTSDMIVDNSNLIHGGFIFGLADYAAMVAINHPNVVLGGANVKFLKPTILGDELIAEAKLSKIEGKKHIVEVIVKRDDLTIFKGELYCYIPAINVLNI
ncbi:MAG: hotdog domain-containing protein [Promethearchaeota archaeon]